MKKEIKRYFESLDPKKLYLKNKVKVGSISKLGMGASNLNYLIKANDQQFIFRMNMDPKEPEKSKNEYDALKIVEKLGVAPKPYVYDDKNLYFDKVIR